MDDNIARQIDDIRATLARLEPMLAKLVDGQAATNERLARIEGRLDEQSTRISDINARLPVPIAYTPPAKTKRRG